MNKLMTIDEVADYFRLCTKSIRNLIKSGKLKASKPGRKYLFKEEDVEDYLNRQQL